jgi:hypothetical protein
MSPVFVLQQSLKHQKPLSKMVVSLLLLFGPAVVHATVLDWPAGGWTGGAPGPGQTGSNSFTAVTPNDVTVAVNNNGSSAVGATWQTGYPTIGSNPLTGGLSGVNGLQLYVVAQASTSSFVRTTVSFTSPVTNLSFQIWDVDASAGQFVDKISNIQGLAPGNITVGPDSVSSAVAGFNTITGSGLSTVVLGTANANNASNEGTVNFLFSGPITQFSFEWSNNDNGLGAQAIALGPLTFNFIPEYSANWPCSFLCAMAIGREIWLRRAQWLKSRYLLRAAALIKGQLFLFFIFWFSRG